MTDNDTIIFKRNPDLRQNPSAEKEIKALATTDLKELYKKSKSKRLFLYEQIVNCGWDLNLNDRPVQYNRVISWLEEQLKVK